ncbi:ATP-binding protein [Pontibacter sp. SGAir0037]|uniref:sensor histidine kinase n=1 Tax=Pontibacter sp. SGAir0037 TaxID=2571030 RepID=UPI0010CCF4D7|nr:GAF domain-containing sensor histidine kinase [Pontibacter sp. SGAir0037]QCR23171.1 histidine kinase [Pontibacter sp. SGAir0037]
MINPKIPENEKSRLAVLHEYQVLGTLPEKDFDDITKIASEICQTPISLINLIDADIQWTKSYYGLEVTEMPRELAFCAYTINDPYRPTIIPDATKDERFHDNPYVAAGPQLIFYTGIPLMSPDGYALGTLCVLDYKPRELTQNQLDALRALANQVMSQLELRRRNRQLEQLNKEMSRLNRNLAEFSYRASHNLKTPLRGISSLATWLQDEYGDKLDAQGMEYLSLIHQRTNQLHQLINGILTYSKVTTLSVNQAETFDLTDLIREIITQVHVPASFVLDYPQEHPLLLLYQPGLHQILHHLISNAVKYNNKEMGEILVDFMESDKRYLFYVIDNGPGIQPQYREKVFQLFETLHFHPNQQENSVGVGLATVKAIVEKMHGHISIIDRPDNEEGACFRLEFEKPRQPAR